MTTDLTADRLRAEALASEAAALTASVDRRERECPHNRETKYWGEILERSRGGIYEEPDPSRPIFAGIDVMGYETRQVSLNSKYWQRRCQLCGKIEETEKTREVVTKVPDFSRLGLSPLSR